MTPPCLWDSETLLMERTRFPSINELIVGNFRRHSRTFYEWRIQDRQEKIAAFPDDPNLYDDLAVSYEKIGETGKAIDIMLQKDAVLPGLYETYANLGTFYIHQGEYEKGLVEIEKAIAINPEAHFGREIYQKLLVEFLIARSEQNSLPPNTGRDSKISGYPVNGFTNFVLKQQLNPSERRQGAKTEDEIANAIKGVTGMMRFGNFDSPVLLEALADLLMSQSEPPRRLAARALLQAATKDTSKEKFYLKKVKGLLYPQQTITKGEVTVEMLQAKLNVEVADAEDWFEQIRLDEKAWVEAGKDVEAEYAAKYFADPAYVNPNTPPWLDNIWGIALACSLGLFSVVVLFWRIKHDMKR
jgi:tetratricopeptide (TPR) repeat protein